MADFAKITHTNWYIGASTDTKPTNVPSGSTCLEYDTDALFITYNDGADWVQKDTLTNISTVAAAKLQIDAVTRTAITCTLADTDYPAAAVIPAGVGYIMALCSVDCIVQVEEATTASIGCRVPAGTPITFPVVFGDGDSKVHVQSPTAGAVVYVNYLQD